MDPAGALADLLEISSQVERAVVVGDDGGVLASTFDDDAAAARLADVARELLAAAAEAPPGSGRAVTQLEVALPEASVFVVRDDGRLVAAVTAPDPTPGLVLYDLRACLRALDAPPARKPRARRAKRADADA